MKYWNIYAALVKHNCTGPVNTKDLVYWRNNLFAGILIYMLPFSLIALVPALLLIFATGRYMIAVVDLLTLTGMAVIAFVPGIKLTTRKIIYIAVAFAFSSAQLYYTGIPGPGLVYLLVTCIFGILIFQTAYRFWPAWVNTAICLLFTVAILLGLLPWPANSENSAMVWVVASANLIFLSFLTSALIPRLFNGLQQTLLKEKQLGEQLNIQQQSLQQALDMLQQKNSELQQFAYVASHDLKEPLRMVTSFMGMLKNKYGNLLDEKGHSYIGFAIDGGKRMQKMIDDLLELSRTARPEGAMETVDFNDLLKEVTQNIFRLIEENQAKINVKTALPVLPVYPADIVRLLQNLLSNAIKFRRKEINPLIIISAAELETNWLFAIEDNGIGMEKDKLDTIFEIFARLHSQEAYEGTGIGLAVCRKVAEQHGGEIWVKSEEDKGSTFYFTIKK